MSTEQLHTVGGISEVDYLPLAVSILIPLSLGRKKGHSSDVTAIKIGQIFLPDQVHINFCKLPRLYYTIALFWV